jgi:uncharacterized protein YbjT (DUF2867 family)
MPNMSNSPRNILLLGASGKIGLEIRKALHNKVPDSTVYCCSRQPWTGPQYAQEQWLVLDPFADAWGISQPINVVINAVGAIHETPEMSFEKVHLGLTQRLLAQRAQLGQPRIVQVSALGADLQARTAFLRTKGEADALLLTAPDTAILRPSIVCTPGTMLSVKLQQLLKIARFAFGKLLVPTGFAATQIQPIMGADVGEAVATAALGTATQRVVDLVGPQRLSFGTLIAEMAAAQNRQVRLLEVSREIVESFVKHFVSVWFPDLINLDQFQLLFEDNVGDLEATAALLGRMPVSTLPFWATEALQTKAETSPTPEVQGLKQANEILAI